MSEGELIPVKFVYHHNRYAGMLYDVDGNLLRGESGEILNVFKEELKDMMIEHKIRFVHNVTHEPTYAYFVTSAHQLARFYKEREQGSEIEKTYHVYLDF